MHERILQLWASVVLVGVAGAAVPGAGQLPPAASGVAVRGRLVAADTNLPFRDATVSLQPLSSQPPPPGREAMEWMSQASTPVDAEGRFEFPDVRAGSYRVVATPVQTAMRYVQGFYPEASVDGPRSFRVSAAQAPAEIVILVPRGAAISGRVLDEHGAPQSYVSMNVRESLAGGRTRAAVGFAPSQVVRTDDNGSFRLFGLQAGDYIVVAQPPPVPTSSARGIPRSAAYPPTYYPAALSAADAGRLRLKPGDDVGPIDIVLERSRLVTIRGVVVDSTGALAPGVRVKLQKATSPIVIEGEASGFPTMGDGAFEFRFVPPGDYALAAYKYAGGRQEFAWTPVSVSTDLEGVVVRLRPGVDVPGQVIFDTPPNGSLLSLRIRPMEGPGASQSPGIQVKDDASFVLEHLFGPVLLRAEGWPGWQVKSVLYGGRDITDEPTELAPGTELRVILTDRLGTLAGLVTSESGDPIAGAVVVFAGDPDLRHERSTMTKMVYASANGRYVVEGLRAGRYIAVAVPREAASMADVPAAFFELLAKAGRPVQIREREAEALDLKMFAVR